MALEQHIFEFLQLRKDRHFVFADVQHLGSRSQVLAALRALVNKGLIARPKRGTWLRLTTAAYVYQLAQREGVVFQPTYADRWANAVTQLAGDEVKSDATDDLLVALSRAGKLSGHEMARLLIAHHRDCRHV